MNVVIRMDMTVICERLYEASIQAGIVALAMQADIVNEGKAMQRKEHEEQYHYDMRCAKTKVDVMVQDMLLSSMRPYINEFALDVEEESDYKFRFVNADARISLIIDPIDGTLDYIQQKDTYSICSVVIEEHTIQAAVVYFPKRNIAYTYDPNYGVRVFQNADTKVFSQGEQPCCVCCEPAIVYKNHRVHPDIVNKFEQAGYKVVDDSSCNCPDALLRCMNASALCYISDTRNIRDIVIGAILSMLPRGAALDKCGNQLNWPAKGRLPFGIFTVFPEKVKLIIKS